jgi:transposase-like protein
VVEKAWLEEQLASGRSYESIARETGRHPSTVSYWARKHGLTSTHMPRHAARGTIDRELLAEIVACRLTIRDMADVLDRSPTTVRHWLNKYAITTGPGDRRRAGARAAALGAVEPELPCSIHGVTRHVPRGDGTFRCTRCRSAHVADRRRRVKRQLIDEAGGACVLCGYDRCPAALQFHHLDPATKSFALSREGVTRSLARAREEARKCVLLCANCHAEVEGGFAQLPLRSADPHVYPA